nr:response regulator [Anaerolineae bacterium]
MAIQGTSLNGHVITVLGLKGGVGKTTIAVNLGIGLANKYPDARVLVVDGNLFTGDVGPMLNIRPRRNIGEFAELVASDEQLDTDTINQFIQQHESKVFFLLGPQYAEYNPELHAFTSDSMGRIIDELKRHFHYIIIDCGSTLDRLAAAAIRASVARIVVTTPSILSLKDTKILLSELDAAEQADDIFIVLNQYDPRDPIKEEQVKRYLNQPVSVTIPIDLNAREAIRKALPLINMSTRQSPAAAALRQLVDRLGEKFKPPVRIIQPSELGTKMLRLPYSHPNRNYISVMLVDDQDNMKEMISTMLELGQEQVKTLLKIEGLAASGEEAVKKAEELIPDVILMDINMPGMDGLQAAKAIQAKFPSIGIIMVTVHESPEYWREAIKAGVADFIPKTTLGPHIATSVEEVYNRYIPHRTRYQQ